MTRLHFLAGRVQMKTAKLLESWLDIRGQLPKIFCQRWASSGNTFLNFSQLLNQLNIPSSQKSFRCLSLILNKLSIILTRPQHLFLRIRELNVSCRRLSSASKSSNSLSLQSWASFLLFDFLLYVCLFWFHGNQLNNFRALTGICALQSCCLRFAASRLQICRDMQRFLLTFLSLPAKTKNDVKMPFNSRSAKIEHSNAVSLFIGLARRGIIYSFNLRLAALSGIATMTMLRI